MSIPARSTTAAFTALAMASSLGAMAAEMPPQPAGTNQSSLILTLSGLLAAAVVVAAASIRERRLMQKKLRAAENEHRTLFEHAFQMAGLVDLDTRVLTANTAALSFINLPLEEVKGVPFSATGWWPPDPVEQEKLNKAIPLARKGEAQWVQTNHVRHDGQPRIVDFSIKPVHDDEGQVKYLLLEGRDITDFKRAEENLLTVLDNAPLILWTTDRQGVFTLSTGSGLKTLGLKSGQLVGHNIATEFRDQLEAMAKMREALEGRESSLIHKVGSTWWETHFAPSKGVDGVITGVIGVGLEITSRIKALEMQQRLAIAVEQSVEAIMLADAQARIEYVNSAFERITGYSRGEVIGKNPRILKGNTHDKAFYTELWRTILSGAAWSGRLRNKRKDGSLYLEDATITPLLDGSSKVLGFVGVKRDITQDVMKEDSLRQAQRTEAIGKLAGGVAHDFNNILQVIHTNVAFAKEPQTSPSEMAEFLDQIQQATRRATDLTRQLLAFSRRQTLQFSVLNPALVVADVIKLIRRLIGEHIQVSFSPAPDCDHVRADIGQLEQVVLNLCVNARDAMPAGGKLSLLLGNVQLAHSDLPDGQPLKPGRYVKLTIADNGQGMDESTRAKIWDPFFTTKPVGQGTGLGLPVVQGIVQQHGGFLRVESTVGKGTTFEVFLPSQAPEGNETPEPVRKEAEPLPGRHSGHETILLAEDDPSVRQAANALLTRHGYRVLLAADGEEACQIASMQIKSIEILIFDVVMPRLGGIEAAERLSALKPGIPVILCSGYAGGLMDMRDLPKPSWRLIRKPYAPSDLLRELRSALDAPQKSPDSQAH